MEANTKKKRRENATKHFIILNALRYIQNNENC